jgi:Zn-dependent protease with chaperone function
MNNIQQVNFFDGLQAGPKHALMYFDAAGIFIQLGAYWDKEATVLFFPYKQCNIQQTGNKSIVFLNKNATNYISFNTNESFVIDLQQKFNQKEQSFAASLLGMNVFSLAILVVILLAGVYWGISTIVPWAGLKLIKPSTETELGEKMYQSMMQGETIDHQKTKLLQEFAKSMQLSNTYPIKLTVVKSKEVNAYAIPGGNIVVYTGILKAMKSPDELAALLGHETAHINDRHSLKSILRSAATGLIVSVVLNDISGIFSIVVENAEGLRTMHFSRGIEKSADEAGMKTLVKNNIHPLAMKKLMQRLKENSPEIPEVLSFMQSHPATDERIKHATEFAVPYKNSSFAPNPVLDSIWTAIK